MSAGFFLFSIVHHFYGNGRSLPRRHAFRAALMLLFAAVVPPVFSALNKT